ncbi:MAG TPA: class I SAM-dependent methyltransferase [Kofleriaceae bacterium]|nr:class I SAM-dependent methyltransferase [Kofleriaceae bacterium]
MHRNPQAEQMGDESMVRNLQAQAEAIWPQERPLIDAYQLPRGATVLDVGCGTGEWAARLLEHRPDLSLLGIDLDEAHLERARARCADHGERARFQRGDAFALPVDDGACDLVACRHMVQAVPDVPTLIDELRRVTRPGGRLHILAEDYGLMKFHPTRMDSDEFFRRGVFRYGQAIGCDLRIGRKLPALLAAAGLTDVRASYIVIDTLRVARPVFAGIWKAWRDGYTEVLAAHSDLSIDEVRAHWADMIACIEDPAGYAAWLLPAVGARRRDASAAG